MAREAEYETFISELANAVKSIDMKVNFLNQQISEVKADKSQFPKYFAADSDQMENELRARGLLTKPEEGLQDDVRYAFSMFTNINEKGDLIPGLVGAHGPATLMELYQTMDLRGLTFNYGWGWLSALKGGYNVGVQSGKEKAQKTIEEIRQRVLVEPAAIADGLGSSVEKYMNSEKDMEFYIENRDLIKNLNRAKLKSEYISLTNPPKPNKQEAIFYGYKRNKKGNIILDKNNNPKMEPVGKIESTSPLDTYSWPLRYGHKGGTTLFPATNGQNLDQIIQYLFKSKK